MRFLAPPAGGARNDNYSMTTTDKEKNIAALEALLFIHGEPLQLKKVAAALGLEKDAVIEALEGLRVTLEDDGRGIALFMEVPLEEIDRASAKSGSASGGKDWGNAKVQLVTKPAFGEILKQFVKEELESDLTPASQEALSLILYLGPIPRSRLDYLRGVNSSFILKNLLLRGLIERVPDPERPSIFLYRASLETWKHLGVRGAADLPEYEKFRGLAAMGETNAGDNTPPQ